MKIIALETEVPGTPAEQFQPYLHAEARRAWELMQSGALREIYFRADHHTAVLILECADVDAANNLLATLPLVRAGLIAFEVIPLAPYPGFARLFADP
jgi:muconolactone delta-isomerase